MYSIQTKIRLAKKIAQQKRKQSLVLRLASLGMLCCLLLGMQIALILQNPPATYLQGSADWMQGAMLLSGQASGYVVVGVVSCTTSSFLTVYCMKKHQRAKQEEEDI